MGDDLIDFYDTYKERICTFHLKDTADSDGVADEIRYAQDVEICDDGHRWFWEPGEGTLPMKEFWKHVADYGFKGWVTVEDDGSPDYLAAMALASYYINHELGKIYQ
jgi:inosose dehydratase